jgi:hypothetical protein
MSFVASTASNFKSLNSTAETNVAGCRVVNVAITTLDASGDAHHEYVQQDKVTITGIDYEFYSELSLKQSCELLNCFDVSGNGPNDGFAVQIAAVAAAGLPGDVILSAFIADALDATAGGTWAPKALGGSSVGDTDSTVSMLQKDLWQGLVDVIRSDGLINTVEDVLLRNEVGVSIDASNAGDTAATELMNSQEHRNILFTQLPNSNFMLYKDLSENTTTGALPMKDGDTLTFVFDCDMPDVEPTSQIQVPKAGAAAAAAGANGATAAATPAGYVPTSNVVASKIHYNMGKKRLAINLKVRNEKNNGGAFPVSADAALGLEESKLRAASIRTSP